MANGMIEGKRRREKQHEKMFDGLKKSGSR